MDVVDAEAGSCRTFGEQCEVCGKPVRMQVMKGTGFCSLNCGEKKENAT